MDWDNKNFVLTAVKDYAYALTYASERLKDDKEIVLTSLRRNDGGALQYASERLKDDKEIVLTAVKQPGWWVLKYASERLKDDKEVALTAVKNHRLSLEYASPGIQKLCEGQDSVEALTRAIQAEKLQERLNNTLAPKHENTRSIKI